MATSSKPGWYISESTLTDWSPRPLASGGFGDVFTAQFRGQTAAIKRLKEKPERAILNDFRKEVGIWHQVNHPHVLPLLGACDDALLPFMVSPFMPNGTLSQYASDPEVTPEEKLRLLYQVAAAMVYLHSQNIVHGDLKATNILLDSELNAVINDFGMAKTKTTSCSTTMLAPGAKAAGTMLYMAPEMFNIEKPSPSTRKTDVYAFAMTIYEIFNQHGIAWVTGDGHILNPFSVPFQVMNHSRPRRPNGIPDTIWSLIERCWAQDPAARPAFTDILAFLQPYNHAAVPASAIPPPAAKSPSVNRVVSHFTTLSVNNRSPSQSSRPAELKFDGIDDVVHIPGTIVSGAKQGDPSACLEAAKLVSEGLPARHQDWKLAGQLYKAAADRGELEASFQMAWLAFLGEGMAKNDRSAFWFWQEVSTKSNDPVLKPIATHMVGWMHYLGRGTVRDQQKGVKIIRENDSDEFKLGEDECLAAWWNNIKSDSPAACKFFELCQLGSDRDWLCSHLMAVCVFHGFGTTEDKKKAAGIFEQLANEGHSDSQLWIGICYYWGGGVSRDEQKAFEWFSKSADQGNSYGQWRVGVCYYCGDGVTLDRTKAAEWWRKSAEQGNRYGQNDLGNCYQNGSGVPKDIDTAVFWYRKSAEQGLDWAIDSLKELGKWP